MEAVQVQQILAKDGEVLVTGLPYKRGQAVEIIVFLPATTQPPRELDCGSLAPFRAAWSLARFVTTLVTVPSMRANCVSRRKIGQTAVALGTPINTFNRRHDNFIPGIEINQPYPKRD